MPQLALDDVERDALARQLERVGVAQLVRREVAPNTGELVAPCTSSGNVLVNLERAGESAKASLSRCEGPGLGGESFEQRIIGGGERCDAVID